MIKFDVMILSEASALGLSVSEPALAAFGKYCDLLLEANSRINLTAVKEPDEIAVRHFADSLALLACCDLTSSRVIDIGSGAGFPGLPIRICAPSMELTMLDSLAKRVDFLARVCRELDIPAECVHARAEEAARLPSRRDSYDAAVSRAVARLGELCELCMPFVKPGGVFLAMKAADADAELAEAENAVRLLGGKTERVFYYTVGGIKRSIIIIRKISATPAAYPRRYAKIQKEPL